MTQTRYNAISSSCSSTSVIGQPENANNVQRMRHRPSPSPYPLPLPLDPEDFELGCGSCMMQLTLDSGLQLYRPSERARAHFTSRCDGNICSMHVYTHVYTRVQPEPTSGEV